MKTPRILTTAFLFAASMPSFGSDILISDVSKELAKEWGIDLKVKAHDADEFRICLEVKREGKFKHFEYFDLIIKDGQKVLLESSLSTLITSNPDRATAEFTIGRSLLAKAQINVVAGDENRPDNGIVIDESTSNYVLKLGEHVPAYLLPKEDKPSAEDLALVKSYILKGKVEQTIGKFGFSAFRAGDTFELDLSNLPKERIDFMTPPTNPQGQPSHGGSMPLFAPLEIAKVKKAREGHISIDLSANDSHGEFLIQIVAGLPTEKGTSAYLTFYGNREGGLIGCRGMVSARGELKVKAPVSSILPPKANEHAKNSQNNTKTGAGQAQILCPECQGVSETLPRLGGPVTADDDKLHLAGKAVGDGSCVGPRTVFVCRHCGKYSEDGSGAWNPLPPRFGSQPSAADKAVEPEGTAKAPASQPIPESAPKP